MLKKLFRKKDEDGDTVSILSKEQRKKKRIYNRIETFRCHKCDYDIYSNQTIVGKLNERIVITPVRCDKCDNRFTLREKIGT